MRLQRLCFFIAHVTAFFFVAVSPAQIPPSSPPAPQANTLAQNPGAVTVSLDEAIQMALQHNHTLLAARTVIPIGNSAVVAPGPAGKYACSESRSCDGFAR